MTKKILAASLLLLSLAACGDDDKKATTDTGTTDTSGSADTGTEDTAGSADTGTEDTAGSADTGTEDTTDLDVGLNCDPFERPLRGQCRSVYTRICYSQADCTEEETCTFEGRDTPETGGLCIRNAIPDLVCPGSPSCAERPDATLKAAFRAIPITPRGFELPRANGGENFNEDGNPITFSGDVTDPSTFCDCGRDMICPATPEYADCKSYGTYTGPDADGTEGNGFMEGAWIAGFSFSRPAGVCPDRLLGDTCTGPDCCISPIAHDNIWARGSVIEQGESRIAFLTVDTVGFFFSDIRRIKARLDPALGIDDIVISATHTHEAPDTMGQWGPGVLGSDLPDQSGVVDVWMEDLYTDIAAMIGDAARNLEPVDVYAMKVNTDPLETALRDSRSPFIANNLITGVRFVRDGQDVQDPANTLGTYVNWHSHPEVLWSENVFITSDFPHFLRESVEGGLAPASDGSGAEVFAGLQGLGGVAVYITGSCGGLLTPGSSMPVKALDGSQQTGQDFTRAEALGQRLAVSVLGAFQTPCEGANTFGCYTRVADETLSFASREFTTDIVNRLFHNAVFGLNLFRREVYNWRFQDGFLGPRFPQVGSKISQIRIGGVTFSTVPGETFSESWTGGFTPNNQFNNPTIGDPNDVNCSDDRVTRIEAGVEPRFGCLVELNIPTPLDLANAPTTGYFYESLPGDYIVAVGLGNDELGYIPPPYDFIVDPFLPFLIEAPGHYEETNSAANRFDYFSGIVSDVNALLNR